MIQFHFADEPIARRSRFHAKRRPNRVIFLDIDGVLNGSKTPNPRDLPYIVDRRLLRTFRKLVFRTRAKVVLIRIGGTTPLACSARATGASDMQTLSLICQSAPAGMRSAPG